MAEKYVSFRMGKETSLGSEVAPSDNNPFMDGTFVFAYNDKYNHFDSSDQIVDGRLYIDATIDNNNYRFPINSECSYFLINAEDGTDYAVGDENSPIYFANGIPQEILCVKTQAGGTGLTSFTSNRIMWSSSESALTTSAHYVDSTHLGVNYTDGTPNYNLYVNGTTGFANGHIYLTGAHATSSTGNKTQIIFGVPSNNHLAISSNDNALVLNATSTSTAGQIVLDLDGQSSIPKGIKITNGDIDITGSLNASNNSTFGADVEVGNNLTVQSNLIVNTDASVAGTLTVDGDTTLKANLSVKGDSTILGSQTIETDLAVTGNAAVTGNVEITGTLDVTDAVTFDSTLTVTDDITAKSNVNIEVNLDVGVDAAIGSNFSVGGQTTMSDSLTFNGSSETSRTITTPSGSSLFISPKHTLYLDSANGTSLIFRPQGVEQGRFNTDGQLRLKSGGTNTATLIGPSTTNGTFYFPNAGGTFVTHKTRGTAEGGQIRPVYIASNGRATACNAPVSGAWFNTVPPVNTDGVFEIGRYIDFHYTNASTNNYDVRIDCAGNAKNTLYLPGITGQVVVHTNDTQIGTTELPVYVAASGQVTSCVGADVFSVLNSTEGTSGETLSITVAGQNRTITLDAANTSRGGVVTTGTQTFAGQKTFNSTIKTSAILPRTDATYNFGSLSNRWNQMFGNHLYLCGTTNATMTAASTNPRITFAENTETQPVHLIYTSYNDYRSPAGLKVIGGTDATPAWFEVEGKVFAGGSYTSTVAGARFIANNGSRSTWFGYNSDGTYFGIYDATGGYYLIRNGDSTHASNAVYLGAATTVGGALTVNGNITATHSSTTSRTVRATNSNGSVGVHTSTNRGVYDFTKDAWIIYTQKSDNTTRVPDVLYLDKGATVGSAYNIKRVGKSSSWYNGRDNAMIRMTSCSGYSPTISAKSTNGTWEIGTYDNSSYSNQLIFGYVTDTNYNAATNSQSTQIRLGSDGTCMAPVWYSTAYYRTANYGTGNPGSSTVGYGVTGALYFKIIS